MSRQQPVPDPAIAAPAADPVFEIALLSEIGADRDNNEDACGHRVIGPESVIFAVADGIGGYEGGEIASAMAIEATLRVYLESPPAWGASKRLYRAVQAANIEIHNRALTVPELRRMGTTLTAAVVDHGVLHAAHVGDCRIYLVRRGRITQITKDHTVVQERVRMGLMTASRARNHPERSALTRSVGHEIIVSIDRITLPLEQHDRLIICSDGLHGVLEDRELEQAIGDLGPDEAVRQVIEIANQRGTADNLTVGVFDLNGGTSAAAQPRSLWGRLTGFFRSA
jgi:serine/threonine protein phosphatase PrpC